MSVKITRTWETIIFEAVSKDGKLSQTIHLTLNNQLKTYELCTPPEDSNVSLKKKSLQELELKLEAIKAAVSYVKYNLNN